MIHEGATCAHQLNHRQSSLQQLFQRENGRALRLASLERATQLKRKVQFRARRHQLFRSKPCKE